MHRSNKNVKKTLFFMTFHPTNAVFPSFCLLNLAIFSVTASQNELFLLFFRIFSVTGHFPILWTGTGTMPSPCRTGSTALIIPPTSCGMICFLLEEIYIKEIITMEPITQRNV